MMRKLTENICRLTVFGTLVAFGGLLSTISAYAAGCETVRAGGFDVQRQGHRTITGFLGTEHLGIEVRPLGPGGSAAFVKIFQGTTLAEKKTFAANVGIRFEYTLTAPGAVTVELFSNDFLAAPVLQVHCTNAVVSEGLFASSDALGLTQSAHTATIVGRSGGAISDAAYAGVTAAFDGGDLFDATSGSITLNYAPGIGSSETSDAQGAIDGLDGGRTGAGEQASWNLWANFRGGWLVGNSTDTGGQFNGTGGLGFRVSPSLTLGVLGGFETLDYSFGGSGSDLEGTGGTVGLYGGWQLQPALRLTGLATWTGLDYDAEANGIAGRYFGSRWMTSIDLSGSHDLGWVTISPNGRFMLAFERQDAYRDTAGIGHDSLDVFIGQASFGGRFSRKLALADGVSLMPYVGGHADWTYDSEDAPSAVNPLSLDDWTARISAGMSLSSGGGSTLQIGGEYGGIGADTQDLSANLRISVFW